MPEFTWPLPTGPAPPEAVSDLGDGVVDHVTTAVNRLPQQFQGKPKIATLLRCLLAPLADLEQAMLQVRTLRNPADATGEQLTILAKIVGQLNIDFTEEELRTMIFARVRANKSNGLGNDVLRVARLVIGDGPTLVASNEGTAAFSLRVDGEPITFATAELLMTQFMRDVVPGAGIRCVLEFILTADPTDTFRFDTVGALGDTINPSNGALLASAME